jgi:hypothetical protein
MCSDHFKAQSSRKARRKHVGLTSDASCNRSYSKRQTLRRLAPRDNAHIGHHITTRTRCSCPRSGTAQQETSRVPARVQKSQPDRRSSVAGFGQRNHGGASLPTITSFTDPSFTDTCTTRLSIIPAHLPSAGPSQLQPRDASGRFVPSASPCSERTSQYRYVRRFSTHTSALGQST